MLKNYYLSIQFVWIGFQIFFGASAVIPKVATLTKRIEELAAANAELAACEAARPNKLAVPKLQQVT